MAANDEEIRRLAELGAHMEHVLRAIAEVKAQLAELVTRAELSTVIDRIVRLETALVERITRLEKRVDEQSPLNIWKRVTAVAIGVVSIGGAIGLLLAFSDKFK